MKHEANMLERIVDGRTDLVFDYCSSDQAWSLRDQNDLPLIKWCAYYGDVSAIRYLLGQGERLETLGENLGLNEAAFHGFWQLVQFLVENGADVDYPLPDTGETPLHSALCKANRPQYDLVLKVLLDAGADPRRVTKLGAETGSFMRDCRTKAETPLHRAAAFGSETSIRLLLDAGAQIDAKDMNGDSPLTWASWHLRPDAVLRLLCYGEHTIHPARNSTYDHGTGWGVMNVGKPHLRRN